MDWELLPEGSYTAMPEDELCQLIKELTDEEKVILREMIASLRQNPLPCDSHPESTGVEDL